MLNDEQLDKIYLHEMKHGLVVTNSVRIAPTDIGYTRDPNNDLVAQIRREALEEAAPTDREQIAASAELGKVDWNSPVSLLEGVMRLSIVAGCDCNRSDMDLCHGDCAAAQIASVASRARKLLKTADIRERANRK